MTRHEFDTILLSGEGYKVEFKQAVNSDLSKEMAAFANASGGRIFVGVADNGTVSGITITNKLRADIESYARTCDPAVSIELEEFDDKIIIIHVKEGIQKPYRCTAGFYLRTGASSVKMSTQEIIEFFKSEGRVRFDEMENTDAKFPADLDEALVLAFMGLAGISSSLKPNELLSNLGVVYSENGKTVFNNGGVLFFSKNPNVFLPQSVVTCVAYKGNKKVDIIDRKIFEEDIIANIEDALHFLKRHLNLALEIKSQRRKENLELPEVVLREAVVNSVAHRDYFQKGATVMIEVFDNRVEISNPGGLPRGLTEKDFGTRTLARNPLIASLLSRARYIEKLGTGIPRIREKMQEFGLPEPVFVFNSFFTVTLKRYNPIAEIKKSLKLTDAKAVRIIHMLETLSKRNKLEPEKLASELGATARTIRNDIDSLEKAEWVESKGSTSAREYVLTDAGTEVVEKYF